MAANDDKEKTARQGRSPAYPAIALRKALERADQLRRREGKHAVPLTSAYKSWDLGEKGSLGRQTVAALRYFGMIEYEGQGAKRLLKLTETALKILLDKRPESTERRELIKEVALKPTIYAQMWKEWGPDLPSDGTIETYLVRDNGFSETAAPELITSYKDTLDFARLRQSEIMSDFETEIEGQNDVQAESIIADVTARPSTISKVAGEREVSRGPLSKNAGYRLLMTGDASTKDWEKLIRILQLQVEILQDDDTNGEV